MEIIQMVRIPVDELNDKLHYRLICETIENSKLWYSGKVQANFRAEFSKSERDMCVEIYQKSFKLCYRELPQEPLEMSMSVYKLWLKLGDFILKYCYC